MTPDIYYHGPVVVFDLDDTLFSEREHAVAAYGAVAAMDDIVSAGLGDRAMQVMTRALERRENPFDALQALLPGDTAARLDTYRSFTPRTLSPRPGTIETLRALTARGVRCALITDGRSHTQRAKIKALGIAEFFHPDDIIVSGETGHDKSETHNFAAIVHHYPEANRFIYVGDNPARDFYAPHLLGWDTYMLRAQAANIHLQGDAPDGTQTVENLAEVAEMV